MAANWAETSHGTPVWSDSAKEVVNWLETGTKSVGKTNVAKRFNTTLAINPRPPTIVGVDEREDLNPNVFWLLLKDAGYEEW